MLILHVLNLTVFRKSNKFAVKFCFNPHDRIVKVVSIVVAFYGGIHRMCDFYDSVI